MRIRVRVLIRPPNFPFALMQVNPDRRLPLSILPESLTAVVVIEIENDRLLKAPVGRSIGSVHCFKPCFVPQETQTRNFGRHCRIGYSCGAGGIEHPCHYMVLVWTAGGPAVHSLPTLHGRCRRDPKISREPVSTSHILIERSRQRGEYGHHSNDDDSSNNGRSCRQFEHVNRWGGLTVQ